VSGQYLSFGRDLNAQLTGRNVVNGHASFNIENLIGTALYLTVGLLIGLAISNFMRRSAGLNRKKLRDVVASPIRRDSVPTLTEEEDEDEELS